MIPVHHVPIPILCVASIDIIQRMMLGSGVRKVGVSHPPPTFPDAAVLAINDGMEYVGLTWILTEFSTTSTFCRSWLVS